MQPRRRERGGQLAPATRTLPGTRTGTRVFHEAGQRITLHTQGARVDLRIGDVPILTSVALGTEKEFGALARTLCPRDDARILIGGLGFGSTLAAALAVVGPSAEVIVVEKLRTVITLMRGPLGYLAPGVLDDPRVRLVNDDVAAVLARERDLDVVLLDVDNGPEWASFRSNARLYEPRGLHQAHDALKPGGAYAVWAGYPLNGFVAVLRSAGFSASVLPLRERGEMRARAYVGRRRP